MYDPLVAAADGVVIYVGYYGTGGKTVMIDVGSGITIIYHHLNDYSVTTGQQVTSGQIVGHVGMTGVSSGPHLHFSVRVNGQYVDPKPYLGI
jgi:murein DD-endopeptidase MepM/ murein hydrolase activator NlpD